MNRPGLILASSLIGLLSIHTIRRNSEVSESRRISPTTDVVPAAIRRTADPAPPQRNRSATPPNDEPSPPSFLDDLKSLDPFAALNALEELLQNAESSELHEIISWLISNPNEAAEWIESLTEGALQNAVVERLLAKSTAHNPSASLAIAEKILAPELRDAALSSVIRRWAADAPRDALAIVAAREDWRESPMLGRAFASAIAEHPREIGELLELVPERKIEPSFFASAAELVLAREPAALALWFETIRDPECRSTIAETVVRHVGRNGPELAFPWATLLKESQTRQEMLAALFDRAVARDQTMSSTLLNSPWLSALDRAVLISRIEIQK